LRNWYTNVPGGQHGPVTVGVYDGTEAGVDTAGGRWQTVCEDHGQICSHTTLADARWHGRRPAKWCEVCSGNLEPGY